MDHFSDITAEKQNLVAEFLSVSPAALQLVEAGAASRQSEEAMDSEVQFEERPDTTYVKAVRPDTKTQRNTVLLTCAVDKHPVYTLRVVRSVAVLGEAEGQFAKFRDLYVSVNSDGFCDTLLTAPFPHTKRRSSIGFKLSDDMVEVRRQELKTVCSLKLFVSCTLYQHILMAIDILFCDSIRSLLMHFFTFFLCSGG
jgi:hypothetical protein